MQRLTSRTIVLPSRARDIRRTHTYGARMHIPRRHLNYANVVATLALVFAMSGGALAAKHYLINSTKQINPKVLKKLKGNTGKTGATGAPGKEGSPGKEGPPNPNALFATNASHASNADTATVANGQGTLASKHTEVGVFAGRGTSAFQDVPISFPIPLSAAPEATVLASGTTTTDCKGSAAEPSAAPGHLCVYEEVNTTGNKGVPVDPALAKSSASGRYGLFVFLNGTAGSDNVDYGSWAVTAP